jgi:uncharacterized protein YndB with AHSA1/START domain
MNDANDDSARAIVTTRVLPFPPEQVFRAIADRDRIARWWGPAGFRNTITQFDFRPGGEWKLTMHGPDGKDWPNECRFETIEAPHTVVVRHENAPHFRLSMTLAPESGGTRLQWRQVFDDAKVRDQLAAMCVPANEQNFDRLQAELSSHP